MQIVAVYSRKSKFTGKGDSIENQIEMCKQYITHKLGENVEFLIYEDEGFSGSTLERPQFKKLMKDITAKNINALVCYRLDRISRNVADFSSTLTMLQDNNCSFISIREEFDTTSPMGRAMIYIASVFAQLERETIAERVRDNMLELAKSGRWTGGKIPLGFTSHRIKYTDNKGLQREYSMLNINEEEMSFVKFLYEKYLDLGSLYKLEVYITENQLRSRNGIMFEKSSLKIILQNPIYTKSSDEIVDYLTNNDWIVYGKADNSHAFLTYNKTEQGMRNGKHVKILKPKGERFASISNIEGALDSELWLNVQRQFDENRNKFPRLGKTHNALLVGKLKCGKCKKYMLIQHGRESKITGAKTFYYVCSLKRKSHKSLCDNSNAKASYVDSLVIASLKLLSKSKTDFVSRLKSTSKNKIKSNQNPITKVSLENSLNEKKKQIDTLITTLSKSDGIEDLLLNKIKSLKSDCTRIESKMIDVKTCVQKEKLNGLNIDLIESILGECEMIDTFSQDEQKKIIDILIDCIYWYGSGNGKGKIEIRFAGTDSDDVNTIEMTEEELRQQMLQLGSHSMTCI